jgi:hypothetical protein
MGAAYVGLRFFGMPSEVEGTLVALTLVLCVVSDVVQHQPD